ncbi:MAG: Z1 domain-containing protein [Saccharofermentanales bacterium]
MYPFCENFIELAVKNDKKDYFLSNEECREEVFQKVKSIDQNCIDADVYAAIDKEIAKYTGPILSGAYCTPLQPQIWVNEDDIEKYPYWVTYVKNLKKYQDYTDDMVSSLARVCLTIVNYLAPPKTEYIRNRSSAFIKKGLVYGNVQSGKTASMGGVVAQYAASGCRIIIVLSGSVNNLWDQTNSRLRRDLGIDDTDGTRHPWEFVTDDGDNIKSSGTRKIDAILNSSDSCMFGVFKKNAVILDNLIKNFLSVNDQAFYEVNSVLVIDDECDQASINTKKLETGKRTSINNKIVEILHMFKRYAYIGYTATPFANVLNEPPGIDSLYPSDFIVALPQNKEYFSVAKVFGCGEEYSNVGDPDSIDCVNEYEKKGSTKGNSFSDEELVLLKKAIQYFLLATSCKYWRAMKLNNQKLLGYSTMMVHNTQLTGMHSEAENQLGKLVSEIRNDYKKDRNSVVSNLQQIWKEQFEDRESSNLLKINNSFGHDTVSRLDIPSFDDLMVFFPSILDEVTIVVDNSQTESQKRLHYGEDSPRTVIAIGGNTLSRGITLEGLVVSFFSRNVNTYDTLLQMGRWFGYKPGFEDLVRLWVPKTVKAKYQFLSGVEYELRESIQRYKFDSTPTQVAMSIRTNPHMKIVRKMAMQSAESSEINYSGHRPQTIYFERDSEWLQNNIDATSNLLSQNLQKQVILSSNNVLFESISEGSLLQFLNSYHFHQNSLGLSPDLLLRFISKAKEEGYMDSINLVLKTKREGKTGIRCNLFSGIVRSDVFYLNRSALKNDKTRVNLKAITSPEDILADIPDEYNNGMTYAKQFEVRNRFFSERKQKTPGLIVLYPIYSKSKAKIDNKDIDERVDLDLEKDIIGVCFVFPNIERNLALFNRVSIPLDDKELI